MESIKVSTIKQMSSVCVCVHMYVCARVCVCMLVCEHSTMKKNEILSFDAHWMELEDIMLSEIHSIYSILYLETWKEKKHNVDH